MYKSEEWKKSNLVVGRSENYFWVDFHPSDRILTGSVNDVRKLSLLATQSLDQQDRRIWRKMSFAEENIKLQRLMTKAKISLRQ